MVVVIPGWSQSREAQYPIIKNYGGIYEIPFATERADSQLYYDIAIEVKMGSDSPGNLNPALNNIARLMNLHGLGGVPPDKLNVVAIVHGLATTSIITDQAYKVRFGQDNPNSSLIKELQKAGVKIVICGQSMLARDVSPEDLAEGIEVSISMLTTFTTLQLKGYAALQF